MKLDFGLKNILATLSCCFLALTLIGQSRQMNVPEYSQETGFWCWAACMEMIIDFHIPANASVTNQCSLVKERFLLGNPSVSSIVNPVICCSDCSNTCPFSSVSGCSNILSGSSSVLPFPYNPSVLIPDYYDRIFMQNGFTSTQEINYPSTPMPWGKIKQQIKECRPFVLNVSPAPSLSIPSDHALVVKGYQEGSNLTNHVVVTNDPWKPCCANGETLLPYFSLFASPTGGTSIFKVLSTVHSINPDVVYTDISNCISCEALDVAYKDHPEHYEIVNLDSLATGGEGKQKNNSESKLLNLVNQNQRNVVGFPNFEIKEEEFEKYLRLENYPYAPVQYISPSLVRRSGFWGRLFPHKKVARVTLEHPSIVEIVSARVDKNLVTTFQQSNQGTWKVRRISNYTHIEDDIIVTIKNSDQSVKLKNIPEGERNIGNTNFTLLRYLPFTYEFYAFEVDGKEYVSLAEKYPKLGLEKGIGYPEREFLNALRTETRIYQEVQKRLNRPTELFNFLDNNNRLLQGG